MKCPLDDTVLQMTDRQGIEIDYCPQCRGVWLDRGELDKLIDRSLDEAPTSGSPGPQATPRGTSYDQPGRGTSHDQPGRPAYPQQRYDDRGRDSGYYKKRKKESFLGEIFDF